jgi:hypothetical protein
LWGGTKPGMVDFMTADTPNTRMAAITITEAMISFLVMPPISLLSRLAFSRRPGIVAFSGFMTTMKKPHSRKVISQPMGAI